MTVCHSSVYELIREFTRMMTVQRQPVRPRVLVVDDDDGMRRFVNRVLQDAGYDTAVAGDGLEALAVAQQGERLDLVVTDLVMPAMNGDELARRLRRLDPGLKVLYLTGFSDRLFESRACLWEDEAYLDKPCSATALLQAVALLAHGRLRGPGDTVLEPVRGLDTAA